jgi:hypothetical protein
MLVKTTAPVTIPFMEWTLSATGKQFMLNLERVHAGVIGEQTGVSPALANSL